MNYIAILFFGFIAFTALLMLLMGIAGFYLSIFKWFKDKRKL